MQFLISFLVNAIVLWLVITFVPGFTNGAGASGMGAFGVWTVIWLAIVFGIVNALIGPILRLISAPLTWLTHGLFSVVVNWALLALAVYFTPNLKGNWQATLIGAVVLMLVGTLVAMMSKPDTATTV